MRPERRLPQTAPLTLEVIRDVSHFRSIKAEWSKFAAGLDSATPFQLPEWQLAWWSYFGRGDLHVMVFRSVDSIVAIVPCFRDRTSARQQLLLIGDGLSAYLDPPLSAPFAPEILNLLRGHLLADNSWQLCDWPDLDAATPLAHLVLNDKFTTQLGPGVECTELLIQGSFAEFWENRSPGLRRSLLRDAEKANDLDTPRLEVVAQPDPEFMSALIRLLRGHPSRPGYADFLYEIAAEFDRADMLRLFGLRYRGKIAAVTLAFVYRNTIYSYASASDPNYEMFGFSRKLLCESLEHAFEQRYRAWNFLRGNEPYKVLWGARVVPKARLLISRKS